MLLAQWGVPGFIPVFRASGKCLGEVKENPEVPPPSFLGKLVFLHSFPMFLQRQLPENPFPGATG